MKAVNNKLDLIEIAVRGQGDMKARVAECLKALNITAMSHANEVVRIGGIAACFRSANALWRSFTKHLRTMEDIGFNPADFPRLDDMYVEDLSRTQPEIFFLCMQQKAFLSYTVTPEDTTRLKRAELSLKSDKQPRLALRMYQNFNNPGNPASVKNQQKR